MKRKNNNVKMLMFIIIVFCIIIVFFTSKMWLPDDRKIMSVDKVILQNRLFSKVYEKYDSEYIEIKLNASKMVSQYENASLLEKYSSISVTINNKKNEASFVVLYNELLEYDELIIQIPYKQYVSDKNPLYYVEIRFDTNLYIQSDYRKLQYVNKIKSKDEGYSKCLNVLQEYEITKKDNENLDIDNAIDDIQREAIYRANEEQKEAIKNLEKEVELCLINYID